MKVLVVRVGALGDVLHALPAVAALRRERPDWEIDWVIDPRWAPVLVDGDGHAPVVRHVFLADTKLWRGAPASLATLRSILKLRRELRAQRYDLAVDMQGTLRSAVIAWMCGAKRVAGYADPRESVARRFYGDEIPRTGTHVVDQGAALLSAATAVPIAPAEVAIPHAPWADEWADVLVAGRRLCVLSAGAGWPAKRWPAQHYGELAQRLTKEGFAVVVNAPRQDDALAAEVIAASDGAATLAVCNVTGMIALVRRAAVLIGGDSGPVHLAAALGTPVVALFGPTDPARNGPWGQGAKWTIRNADSVMSYKRNAAPDPGLTRIDAETVVAAVKAVTASAPDTPAPGPTASTPPRS